MLDLAVVKTWLLSDTALWLLWGLCLLFFLSITGVLTYHWRPYYTFDTHIKTMRLIFYVGGAFLFILSGILIFLR